MWCGISSKGLIEPYFFDGNVDAEAYLRMLEECAWPYLMHRRMWFQQDGAPAHYALTVREFLRSKFGERVPLDGPTLT